MWFLEKKVGFMKDQTFKTWGCWQRKSTMGGNIAGLWKRPRTCVHGCQRVFIEYIDIYDHSYIVQCWCLLCVGVIYICVFFTGSIPWQPFWIYVLNSRVLLCVCFSLYSAEAKLRDIKQNHPSPIGFLHFLCIQTNINIEAQAWTNRRLFTLQAFLMKG